MIFRYDAVLDIVNFKLLFKFFVDFFQQSIKSPQSTEHEV